MSGRTESAAIVQLLADIAETAIAHLESAERETSWGSPTFGPSPSEELQGRLADLHEPLANVYIGLAGKSHHASDCATSCAPAMLPAPCDCDAPLRESKVERLALNLRAYAYAMGAPRTETDEEVALGSARLILPLLEV